MKEYLYEITHRYDGPVEAITGYLNANARPTDLVAITYGDLPVKFYTRLRVMGGLTGENLTGAEKAGWIIIRRNITCEKDQAGGLKRFRAGIHNHHKLRVSFSLRLILHEKSNYPATTP